jgi:hypothetical protein
LTRIARGGNVAVYKVSNSDSTLTISPNTGAVIASVNLSSKNMWLAAVNTNTSFGAYVNAADNQPALLMTGGGTNALSILLGPGGSTAPVTGIQYGGSPGVLYFTNTSAVEAVNVLFSTGVTSGNKGAAWRIYGLSGANGEYIEHSATVSTSFRSQVLKQGSGAYRYWSFENGGAEAFRITTDPFVQMQPLALTILGSSTGYTTLTTANASATNYTATYPANSGTLAEVNLAQPWTAKQDFSAYPLVIGTDTTEAITETSTLNSGLVGYWPFDESSGTHAYDLSGNGNTATFTGSPTWATGKFGDALTFGGASSYQYLTVPTSASISPTTAITLSAWVNWTSNATNGGILDKGPLGNAFGDYDLTIQGTTGVVLFALNTNASGTLNSAAGISASAWHHIVATYDEIIMKIYIDGVFSASQAYAAAINTSGTALNIGTYYGSSNSFDGKIDDVRIYNRALSASEVLNLYNSGPTNPFINATNQPVASTGSTTLVAPTNSPAVSGLNAYTHLRAIAPDGSIVWVAAYK